VRSFDLHPAEKLNKTFSLPLKKTLMVTNISEADCERINVLIIEFAIFAAPKLKLFQDD
jgi:hypothetical protein